MRIRPNGRGPRSQRGTIRRRGKSCFPHSTLVFVQTGQTVSPRPPCSPLLSVLALFFSFFPFHPNLSAAMSSSSLPPPRLALTQVISHWCHLNTTTTAPTLWPLQPLPCHPLQGAKHPLDSHSLTCVMGTHKPPRCHRPHCA